MPRHPPNALTLLEIAPCNTDQRNPEGTLGHADLLSGLLNSAKLFHTNEQKPVGDAQNLIKLNAIQLSKSLAGLDVGAPKGARHSNKDGFWSVCIYAGHTSMREQTRSRTPGILCKSSSVSGVARQNLVANTSNMM